MALTGAYFQAPPQSHDLPAVEEVNDKAAPWSKCRCVSSTASLINLAVVHSLLLPSLAGLVQLQLRTRDVDHVPAGNLLNGLPGLLYIHEKQLLWCIISNETVVDVVIESCSPLRIHC